MGDPLQTGRELNRIHRPKFPTVLFGITVILTLVGIVMQGILLSHMEMVGAENYLRNTILYNGIGLLLILGLLYETGTFQLWADGAFYSCRAGRRHVAVIMTDMKLSICCGCFFRFCMPCFCIACEP